MQHQVLQRFIGEEAKILNAHSVVVNRFVVAHQLHIQLTENPYKEEIGGMIADFQDNENPYVFLLYLLSSQNATATIVYQFQFLPEFFELFGDEISSGTNSFRFEQDPETEFIICQHSHSLLHQMQQITDFSGLLRSLHYTEIAIQLLRRAIEHVSVPFKVCPVPACRFLTYQSEREKIIEARKILELSFDQPISIKELSRKVAMNECYLKKGFKTLTGKTINEFQQEQRIGRAKELLQERGQSVSEVANTLGYSSISHFSTAFKKATGMKPCELLV